MDFITQLFLTNWIIILVMATIDKQLLDNEIEEHPFWGIVCGLWAIISLASIPYWLLHLIWT